MAIVRQVWIRSRAEVGSPEATLVVRWDNVTMDVLGIEVDSKEYECDCHFKHFLNITDPVPTRDEAGDIRFQHEKATKKEIRNIQRGQQRVFLKPDGKFGGIEGFRLFTTWVQEH